MIKVRQTVLFTVSGIRINPIYIYIKVEKGSNEQQKDMRTLKVEVVKGSREQQFDMSSFFLRATPVAQASTMLTQPQRLQGR